MGNEEENLVYDLAILYKKIDPKLTYESAIRHTLKYIFLNLEDLNEISRVIGSDACLDFKNLESSFREGNFEELLDASHVLNSNPKGLSARERLKWLHTNLNKKPFSKDHLYYLIAEKIRKEHFPTSALESIIIANGGNI